MPLKMQSLEEPRLDLTPMIDVVFQLLIFFLVAAKFEEEERNMPLPLPQASEAMPRLAKPKEIFINVDQAGRILLGADLQVLVVLFEEIAVADAALEVLLERLALLEAGEGDRVFRGLGHERLLLRERVAYEN